MHRSGQSRLFTLFVLALLSPGLLFGVVRAQSNETGPPSPLPSNSPPAGTSQRRTPPNLNMPPVRVEPEMMDFGDLTPGTKAPGTFKLTNVGHETLVITTAMSTCWCTVAQPDDRIMEPGETVELPLTFESGDYLGVQERDVMVRFEGYSKTLRCRIRADVNHGVRVAVEFDPPSQMRQGIVTLKSVADEPFQVLSVSGELPNFADGYDPARDEPRNTYSVHFNAGSAPPEQLPRFIAIELDHPHSPVVEFPVPEYEPKRELRPWNFFEQVLRLGTMFEGDVREFTVTMERVASNPLTLIDRISVYPDVVDVRIMGMAAEMGNVKLRLQITPKPGVQGLIMADLVFVAADHDESITILGRVPREPEPARDSSPAQAP